MRLLNLTIASCSECPYCHFDGDYGRSYNDGYECLKVNKRIMDWENFDENIKIPEWCPLPEKM